MKPIEWVRWCLADHDPSIMAAMIEQLESQGRKSLVADPVLIARSERGSWLAAGYLVICPGALGVIGHVRMARVPDDNVRAGAPVEVDRDLDIELLTNVLRELTIESARRGVELVQRIVPIPHPWDEKDQAAYQSLMDVASKNAGFHPFATLVQLDRFLDRDWIPPPLPSQETNDIQFLPHDSISPSSWESLVEATYVGTRDVPELDGKRTIQNTLIGYRSQLEQTEVPWWRVQCDGIDIGCLLLTPFPSGGSELTYLGIIPSWRGRGMSKRIVAYGLQWLCERGISHIALAVDERNTPALRLYEAFGFNDGDRVQAWFHVGRVD